MSASRIAATALLLVVTSCGGDVRSYRARPPAATASATGPAADPAAWRMERPKAGESGEVRFPVPEVRKLKNGLELFVVPRGSEVLTLRFVVRHGASSVGPAKSGLAALTARMLTEGTRRRSSLALAEAVESLGSTLEADAGRDESSVGLSALAGDLDRAVALLAEVVTEPAFDQKEFERVRAEWLDGLIAERQSPDRLASLAALRLLNGPVHGAPVGGGVSDVKRLGLRDLAAFHASFYRSGESALIVVGDVTADAVEKSAALHFRGLRSGKATDLPKSELPQRPNELSVTIVDRPGSVQSALFAAQRFPPRSAAGHEARELLGSLLGGLFTSRINLNLREKHAYTYGARGRPVATRNWGAFVISTSVRTDATAKALGEIVLELKKARDPELGAPIQAAEIERARADLLHGLGARLEHTSGVAESVKTSFVNGLGHDYHSRYPALIAAVGAGEITDSAQLLDPERLLVVIVGDRQQIAGQLAALGASVSAADDALTD